MIRINLLGQTRPKSGERARCRWKKTMQVIFGLVASDVALTVPAVTYYQRKAGAGPDQRESRRCAPERASLQQIKQEWTSSKRRRRCYSNAST